MATQDKHGLKENAGSIQGIFQKMVDDTLDTGYLQIQLLRGRNTTKTEFQQTCVP